LAESSEVLTKCCCRTGVPRKASDASLNKDRWPVPAETGDAAESGGSPDAFIHEVVPAGRAGVAAPATISGGARWRRGSLAGYGREAVRRLVGFPLMQDMPDETKRNANTGGEQAGSKGVTASVNENRTAAAGREFFSALRSDLAALATTLRRYLMPRCTRRAPSLPSTDRARSGMD
jgi:hypothetical protein